MKKIVNNILVTIIAIGLTLITGVLFGSLVAYGAYICFGATFETSIIVGIISGLIGGIVIGFDFVEDFGA